MRNFKKEIESTKEKLNSLKGNIESFKKGEFTGIGLHNPHVQAWIYPIDSKKINKIADMVIQLMEGEFQETSSLLDVIINDEKVQIQKQKEIEYQKLVDHELMIARAKKEVEDKLKNEG